MLSLLLPIQALYIDYTSMAVMVLAAIVTFLAQAAAVLFLALIAIIIAAIVAAAVATIVATIIGAIVIGIVFIVKAFKKKGERK